MRLSMLFVIGLLAHHTVAHGQVDLSRVNLNPLAQIRYSLDTFEGPIPIMIHEDENLFVSQGGATISTLVRRIEQSVSSQLVRGISTGPQLSAFKSALVQSRAGLQDDCEVVTSPRGTQGFIEVIWFGKAARRNSFTLFFVPERSSRAECSTEVASLFNEIMNYIGRVTGNPDTEVLVSR